MYAKRYSRNYGKKKTYKKKYYKKSSNVLKSLAIKPKIFNLRYNLNVGTDGSGQIQFYGSLSDPTKAINGAGTYKDWSNITSLFELFKVNYVKLQWLPTQPNNTNVYAPIYIVKDINDSGSNLASVDDAIEYANPRFKNLFSPWTVVFYPRRLANTSVLGYQNTAGPQTVGSFKAIISSTISTSTTYGRLILTMNVSCLNRR